VNNSTVPDNADRTDTGNCGIIKDGTAIFRRDASHPVSGSYTLCVHSSWHLSQHTKISLTGFNSLT